MPSRGLVVTAIAGAVSVLVAQAAAPANFAGTWSMDAQRSESTHQDVPIGPETLTITQSATAITIETTRKEAKKSPAFHEVLTYRLDGSETANAGSAGAAVSAKVRWEGEKLLTETSRNVEGSTVTTMYALSLSGDDLIVEKTLTVQHGYQFQGSKTTGRGKDVFVRKSQSGN